MRRLLSLVGLVAGLGGGAVFAQTSLQSAPVNPSVEAFRTVCIAAHGARGLAAKAALAAGWTPIEPIAIAAMGGTSFVDATGFRAPGAAARGATVQGVWVIIGRTPMPGFAYPASSCAMFASPADPKMPAAFQTWAGGPPTVDDPGQQLIQYAFDEPADGTAAPRLTTQGMDAEAPGLQAGTVSLVTVVPGAKRSVLVYSVVNP